METKSVVVIPEGNTNQGGMSPQLILGIGCGCFAVAGTAVGVTMLVLYVWAVPAAPPPPPVTVPPRLDYPESYLTKCNRAIENSHHASSQLVCKLGESSFGSRINFVKGNISNDYDYVTLAKKLYVSLDAIYYVVSNVSSRHCPSSYNIIENICSAQPGNITCHVVLSHNTYLNDVLFSNLTINMVSMPKNSSVFDDLTNSLAVSSMAYDLQNTCNNVIDACLTGIILKTFINDICERG